MKEWYSTQDIATETGKDIRKVQEAVRTLRRAGTVRTTRDPDDERQVLIFHADVEIVKRAMLVDGSASA